MLDLTASYRGSFGGYCAALRLFGYGGKIAEWSSEYEDQQSELPEGTLIGVVGKSIYGGKPAYDLGLEFCMGRNNEY